MIFLYGNWTRLPLPTRVLIANRFGIAKVASTHVADNVIVADGYKIGDVENALNLDALKNFTGMVSDDFNEQWSKMLDIVEERDVPHNEVAAIVEEQTMINDKVIEPIKKKMGRSKSK